MTEPRPIAVADAVTAPYWDATREGRLMVQRCDECGSVQFYPRGFCAACGHGEPRWIDTEGTGTIVSHTTVHRSPHPAFEAPYIVALVRLAEGPVLLTNLVDCDPDQVSCDQRVLLKWERLEDGRQLPVFTMEGN